MAAHPPSADFPALRLPCPSTEVDAFLSRPSPQVVASVSRLPCPVVVLGAGGKMGLHLCAMLQRALAAAGRDQQVLAVSRFSSLRDRESFTACGVETLACDLCDPAALAALPEAGTVFFMAGVKFGTSTDPALLRRVNAELPRAVAQRYREARIVAFSTGCVYPFVAVETAGATESLPVGEGLGDYADSCIQREMAFREASQAYGTSVALIRLNYAVEFRYGLLVDIAQQVMAGQPIDLTTGYVNVIWQSDAVEDCILAWELAGAPAAPVNVTGAEVLSVRRIAEDFGRLFDRPVSFTGREARTAWLNNAAAFHTRFGAPTVALQEMERWIAAWLLQGGETWQKPTGFQKRDGKF